MAQRGQYLQASGGVFCRDADRSVRPQGTDGGRRQVSEKHAGFVINRGGATCADVLALIEEVQKRVWEAQGVRLEPEVRIIR